MVTTVTTTHALAEGPPGVPTPRPRHYLMCPPTYFDVVYEINPWMTAGAPVDTAKAVAQWQVLVDTYMDLGHTVDVLDPQPSLPDMVFAANGSTSVGGRVLGATFATPQRKPEAAHHVAWHRENADRLGWLAVTESEHVNEAEGDFAVLGDLVLAGYGFRTDPRGHAELADAVGMPVVSLRLVDERYYHLDTALGVLDDTPGRGNIAYYPKAFSEGSQEILRRLFPEAVIAADEDAEVLGLNFVSDGLNVMVPHRAEKLSAQLAERGYVPIPMDLSELLKGGGSVKCCTQELRKA
ncbi:MAG TPA: arginine deiminase-related protein [Actinomycetales bacterium]|nr:arginine deiminase-related protein [Actinomycetales bacterium]